MSTTLGSVVTVGGGLAGFTLADQLRQGGFQGRIVIIEREPALYDRPPLTKAAFTGETGLADLSFASAQQLADRRVEVLTGREVVAIDGGARLDDGTLV